MKTTFAMLAVCLGLAAAARADEIAPPKTHPDSSRWRDLFAKDLSDAIYPKGVWSVHDGLLSATEDQFIWTKEEYENFIVNVEFKMAPASNSGVFVYGSNLKDAVANSVEIQILDDGAPKWANAPKSWLCGGVFGHEAPAKSAGKKPGEWNRMTVACRGPKIHVLLNGEMVADIDMKQWTSLKKNPDGSDIPPWYTKTLAELPTKGHIGLQGAHGGIPTYFRNMKLQVLSPR